MSSALFETRFFIYFFALPEPSTHRQLLELMRKHDTRLVSAVTLFEIYKLSLEREEKGTSNSPNLCAKVVWCRGPRYR